MSTKQINEYDNNTSPLGSYEVLIDPGTGAYEKSTIDNLLNNNTNVNSNTAHRTSDGKDHSDVGLNNTHRTSVGTDHAYVTKVKSDATVAPTATNDTSEGYAIGSKWVDITEDKIYFCVDSTEDAAVWQEVGAGGGNINANSDGYTAMYLNAQTIDQDMTVGSSLNAMSAGPINVATSVTVTIANSATWVVI